MSTLIKQIDFAEQRFEKSQNNRTVILKELSNRQGGESTEWRKLDKPARYRARLEGLGRHVEADAIEDAIEDDQELTFNPLERILDASELSGIEFFERGVLAARAVGRVEIRGEGGRVIGFGSGAMISPRLFMTNNHVISDANSAALSTVQFEYLNSIAGPREPITFAMEPTTFFVTNGELDCTIVALEETSANSIPLVSRGWCPLIANSGKAIVGERVNIIQHPGGQRMQVVVRDNTIIGVVDSFLHYRADTEPGSSGSPVFNDQWEMAALHHAGKPKRDQQGRILMTDGQPWSGKRSDIGRIAWEANEGIRISEIVRHVNMLNLAGQKKSLWEASHTHPATVNVWSLFDAPAMQNEKELTLNDGRTVVQTTDEHGNPAWLFRLSFGPFQPRQLRPAEKTRKDNHIVSQTNLDKIQDPEVDTLILAQQLVERCRVDGPYYDKDDDATALLEYWKDIDLQAPSAELCGQLHEYLNATHSKRHSYSRARLEFLYPSIDLHPDGQLRNIYSGTAFSPVEAIANELGALKPFAEAMGVEVSQNSVFAMIEDESLWEDLERSAALAFNCEHVVCQSWFDKRQPMKADIHHLFACQPGCNSFRSNIPYWQFSPTDEVIRDDCGRREGKNKFEPAKGKGAVARATMYFLIRYPGEVGNDSRELAKNRAKILLDWHKQFPVDEYEKHRNWLTEKAQGNRNPFIDHPKIATIALLERGFG